MEGRGERDYRYLSKSAGSSTSIFSTYIVFLTKMHKKQTHHSEFMPMIFENTIFLRNLKTGDKLQIFKNGYRLLIKIRNGEENMLNIPIYFGINP